MHIMEGFLPPLWCLIWYILSIPVVVYGVIKIKNIINNIPESKPLLAVTGAFMVIISIFSVPSPTGGCYHITGNGLNAAIFRPVITAALSVIVLLFDLFFTGHGGITTLGASIFAYGIIGPFAAWGIYRLIIRFNIRSDVAIFFAAIFGNLFTYATTSLQFALAFPEPNFFEAYLKFLAIYSFQILVSIAEGIITVLIWKGLKQYNKKILVKLRLLGKTESGNLT